MTQLFSMAGFSEPLTIAELCRTRCGGVPSSAGIYLIERMSRDKPIYAESTGGWFKGKDPNYSKEIFDKNWVEDAHIVYIGKAAGKNGLKQRLKQLVDFGCGKPVGKRGGRLIWHLPDNKELFVRWRTCSKDEADGAETVAIANFKDLNGGLRPFANMNK